MFQKKALPCIVVADPHICRIGLAQGKLAAGVEPLDVGAPVAGLEVVEVAAEGPPGAGRVPIKSRNLV